MIANISDLLVPVSDAQPCGEDLSFSAEFDQIQEARREDDPNVDYGAWQTTLKQADWPAVIACCTDLLRTRSKDLRLAAWLTEGLVKTAGLRGLADGIELHARLMERFGLDIHPQGDEGDQEMRIGTLNWLNLRMSELVRQIPLTRAKEGQYSLNDYVAARQLQAQRQRNAEAAENAEEGATLEKLSSAAGKTEKSLYRQWMDDASRGRDALMQLATAADRQFGVDGPSFTQLRDGIDAIQQRLESIAKELGILSVEDTPAGINGSSDPIEGELAAQATSHGPIRTRAQALEALREVAKFFRTTEPHSPVAYLADKAAHWGAMPLHLWLRSVVKDQSSMSHIEELLGLEADQDSSRGA
ncbi:type VI secretion system protein TssA [Noviherbaspirillum sp.]|jgi:type VI secretion system protein ImpA|uniref:type VI secretion system protein TssA n=1 Tax=Noviherbaspirillum sp. TaxID=1926288 RepID=UPI0025D37604|nr:type VI secretion system protein TssA [Noviherbaspirillum sp.]